MFIRFSDSTLFIIWAKSQKNVYFYHSTHTEKKEN